MTSPSFQRVLRGEALSPPPIWFMRQAGRYLPEYRAVREKAGGFLDLCFDPELAAEVTLQPIRRYDLDAAILFADILLVPLTMGQRVWFEKGEGPRLSPAIAEDGLGWLTPYPDRVDTRIDKVFETVARVREALPADKALIGFAGAPWTVATYMLAGRGSKDPSAQRALAYRDPETFALLMDELTRRTIDYLDGQIRAGADAVMLFDSWASGLPEPFFARHVQGPAETIAAALKARHPETPFIAFPRGAGPLYEEVAALPDIDGIGIDTGLPARWAAEHLSPHGAVQGGLDPLLVVEGGKAMRDAADRLLDAFVGKPYIFNLGHGFVPETPPEHVAALVSHIRGR